MLKEALMPKQAMQLLPARHLPLPRYFFASSSIFASNSFASSKYCIKYYCIKYFLTLDTFIFSENVTQWQQVFFASSIIVASSWFKYDFAKAGADIVAPSDMMDGRILAIKQVHKSSSSSFSSSFSSSIRSLPTMAMATGFPSSATPSSSPPASTGRSGKQRSPPRPLATAKSTSFPAAQEALPSGQLLGTCLRGRTCWWWSRAWLTSTWWGRPRMPSQATPCSSTRCLGL